MAKKNETKKALKKGQSKFMLIGEAKCNDFTFKIDEQSKSSDWVYNSLNLGIDAGGGNVIYSEMMGGYGSDRDNVIYVHGKKKNDAGKEVDDYENKFTIAWEDRFDEDILETIGQGCFITVGLEKDNKDKVFAKKFLSQYDAIEYIKEHLETGMVINVKGNLKYSIYNENVQMKKEINSVFLSKVKDASEYKATFTQTILLDKDSIGKVDKEKAVFPISARVLDYTKMYNGKEVKCTVPFNRMFEFEVNKENPEQTKKILEKLFKVKKGVTELTVEGDIVEGQALVSVSEDDIPEDIKELIDLGIFTMAQATEKMAVGGNKEKRMIIRKPATQLVGSEDNKVLSILKTENMYEEEDLFLDFMIDSDDEDSEPEVKSTKGKAKEVDEDSEDAGSDTDWLNALGE